MSQVAIYALCEFPDLAAVRYVGQSVNPKRRLYSHTSACRERNYRRNWIKAVLSSGGAIGCLVIEWVQPEQADVAERYWISELSRRGYRLTNSSLLYEPVPEYEPSVSFDPLTSTVLLTLPCRDGREWQESDFARQGRAMVRAGIDVKALLNEFFWQGIDAVLSGKVSAQDMRDIANEGRLLQVEKQVQR